MPMWGRMLGLGRSEHYDRGIRLFDQGLYEQAIEAFEQSLQDRGDPLSHRLARFYLAESHTALALASMERGAPERAEAELEDAIAINPNYADLHYHLGCARLSKGDAPGAVIALRRALDINPRYAKAMLQLGVALYASGDRAGGLHRVQEALALDEAFNKAPLAEARAADDRADTETALRHLRRIGEADVDDIAFHAKLAVDLFRRGMLAEAADEFRAALAINPNYADLRNQLGVTLFASGRDAEAEAEFARALAINNRYVEAHVNRGLALRRLGRDSEARAEFEAALELDPDNAVARENLEAAGAAPKPNA
jgi:tetratricopeptide (TPR) repeat protein